MTLEPVCCPTKIKKTTIKNEWQSRQGGALCRCGLPTLRRSGWGKSGDAGSCLMLSTSGMEIPWNSYGCVWKCCVPLNPMVLLIIIPMKNGYFIGKINPTFSDKPISFLRVSPCFSIPFPNISNECDLTLGHCQSFPWFLWAETAGDVFVAGKWPRDTWSKSGWCPHLHGIHRINTENS